jgi:hypothetical protein
MSRAEGGSATTTTKRPAARTTDADIEGAIRQAAEKAGFTPDRVIQTDLGPAGTKWCLLATQRTTAAQYGFALAPSEVAGRDLIIGIPIGRERPDTAVPTVVGVIDWTTESVRGGTN